MQEGSMDGPEAELDSAGDSWRSALHRADESQTHKLALGGNIRVSVKGMLNAVLKVTTVIVSVKQQVLGPGFDPIKLLKLPADVFSAGVAVLGALYESMPAVSYFVAIVLSRSEQAITRRDLLEQVTELASRIAEGDATLPFYFFVTKKMAQQVLKESRGDGLASALEWLATNQFLNEDQGSIRLRDRNFDWGFSAVGA